MIQKISAFLQKYRKFIPLAATATLFFAAYAFGAYMYEGMRDPQIFFNLFRSSPYLLVSGIGMTFVILTGGIDLSVSGIVALITVSTAALIREGWNVWLVMLMMLAMGAALGAIMGSFITFMKVQPFIATLAGMWFARGMCFFISDDAIPINNRIIRILGETKLLIPGLSDPVAKTGDYVSILAVVALLFLALSIYIAHFTRFGRTVYALGGNEQSARLMGLPVNRTKVLVYTFSGFCSGFAGILYCIYVASGHGLYAQNYELDVIASVVMGGTMLTGGSGYVFGTLFGVLIYGVTQTLIQFNGQLSSWWTRIVIGMLTLIFIGIQSILAARKGGRSEGKKPETAALAAQRNRRYLLVGGGLVLILVLLFGYSRYQNASQGAGIESPTTESTSCKLKPYRRDFADTLIQSGALIAYERNGGQECIDEIFAVYPDGRIIGDDGEKKIEKQVTPAEIAGLITTINEKGWFTTDIYDTWHTPCGQCYGYYISVVDQGQQKTVKAVDGGTDAPADYWQVVSLINGIIPNFDLP